MNLSPRFEQALLYAAVAHAGQMRKGTDIPYLAHLLGVASIALEHGANEDEAIGALLHDAGEDAGGQDRVDDIAQRFGKAVAAIVLGCTDTLKNPKPDWAKRKAEYVKRIPGEPASVRLVSASDKLHNARAILRDYRQHGEAVWHRFTGRKVGTLRYYRALVRAFSRVPFERAAGNELVAELDRVVTALERATKHGKR